MAYGSALVGVAREQRRVGSPTSEMNPALVGVAREQRRVGSPTSEMNPAPRPCWCCGLANGVWLTNKRDELK